MTLTSLGDSALVLMLGETVDDAMLMRVQALAAAIEQRRLAGVMDVVPAFATVTVYYEIARSAGYASLRSELQEVATQADAAVVTVQPRMLEIPVQYGGEFGPDLADVAKGAGISAGEVVDLHSTREYRVHAIGFAPGFAYLGGLPEKLHAPRRATPRVRIPAGSVGIGGNLTGVYPLATPGGWNLIGRTPTKLFDPSRAQPALLQTGDRVRFRAATRMEQQFAADVSPTQVTTLRATDRRVTVVRAGMQTTIQDTGRPGHRAAGVPLSGAADPVALRVANLLVGNAEDAAAFEFALVGPELLFSEDTVIALGGAEFDALPCWQPRWVKAGHTLRLGPARHGCRGYLAVAGGVEVPPVLGSRSTYARAGVGGFEGRLVHDGDVLPIGSSTRAPRGRWHIDERILPRYVATPTVRVVPGAHTAQFDGGLFNAAFQVSPQSDRMGVRLTGPQLTRNTTAELGSATVVPGTVQVPPDGHPIVLMADAQTIGGYPQIGHVISVDLPLVAQLRPGDAVRFCPVTLDDAHQLANAREHALALLREGLAQKFA